MLEQAGAACHRVRGQAAGAGQRVGGAVGREQQPDPIGVLVRLDVEPVRPQRSQLLVAVGLLLGRAGQAQAPDPAHEVGGRLGHAVELGERAPVQVAGGRPPEAIDGAVVGVGRPGEKEAAVGPRRPAGYQACVEPDHGGPGPEGLVHRRQARPAQPDDADVRLGVALQRWQPRPVAVVPHRIHTRSMPGVGPWVEPPP